MAVLCEPQLIETIDRLIVKPEPPPDLVAIEEMRVRPYPAEVPPGAHEAAHPEEVLTAAAEAPSLESPVAAGG
jgi:hypothetical protein